MRLHLLTYFGFAALVLGCAGGQSGDLSGNNDGGGESSNGGGNCEEHKQKLDGFDTPTDAGTAEQILAFAERSFEAPLSWKTSATGVWELTPESGVGTIRVDVTRGASAYYVTYAPRESTSGIEIGISCPGPALGIDVHVEVSTDGGALAESYDTVLFATSSELATLSIPVDLEKMSGALAVSYSNPQTELVQVGLNMTLMAEGMTGSLSGLEQTNHGDAISAGGGLGAGVLAVWPGSPACAIQYSDGSGIGVAPEQKALGITGDAAAAMVSGTTPVAVTWRDGSETELTLTTTVEGEGCLRAVTYSGLDGGSSGSVTYPARFALSSADGRLEGEYVGTLLTQPSGEQNTVSADATLELALDQVEQSGFNSVEVPSDVERLAVALSVIIEDGQVSGWVRLNGHTDPPCLTTPPEPMKTPGGGMSSPGCEGTRITQLEIASWADP